jgi:hypothetical protein
MSEIHISKMANSFGSPYFSYEPNHSLHFSHNDYHHQDNSQFYNSNWTSSSVEPTTFKVSSTSTTTTTHLEDANCQIKSENFYHFESSLEKMSPYFEASQEQQQSFSTSVNSWLSTQSTTSTATTTTSEHEEDWEELVSSFSPGSSSTTDTYPSIGSPEKPDRRVTTKWQRKKEYESTLPIQVQRKRRQAANARERKRMTNLNDAFERLRHILPNADQDSKPMSKMEALQMAQAYIKELSTLLG